VENTSTKLKLMSAAPAKPRTPRNTDNKVEEAKRLIAQGLSQQDVAKQIDVSGWTISQWKTKGKLGDLPKGRIPKDKASTAPAPVATTTFVRSAKWRKEGIIAPNSSSIEELQAEVLVLRETVAALKALVPPATLAAYKQARASALAALD
jgi:hypothetical protein